MDTDHILNSLKPYGRFQVLEVVTAGFLLKFFTSMTFISTVFIGWSPPHHCTVPGNDTLNETLPGEYKNGIFIPDQCLMFDPQDMNSTIPCTDGWTFESGGWSTIVTQWVLVCEEDFVSEFSQSLNAIGLLIGSLFFATISDLIGRKTTMLTTNLLAGIVGAATAFVPNVFWYSAMRMLSGALLMGVALSSYVFATEIFPVAQRSFSTNFLWSFATMGQLFMVVFGYFIKDWRYMQLAINIPLFLTIAGFWFFQETIPWLLANKRGKEAARVFRKIAKFNKVSFPAEVVETLEGQQDESGSGATIAQRMRTCSQCCDTKKQDTVAFKEIFRNANLRMTTVLISLAWFFTVFIFYGMTLSTASFAGDRFVNYTLSILVEFVAYISCIFILKRFGRRYPIMTFYAIAGVSLFITGFVPLETASGVDLTGLVITLNTVGKYGISCAFSAIYLYTGELFPTNLRNRGLGIGSGIARIGGIISPFAAYLSRYHTWLVGVVFGVLSILTGLLIIPLPETGHASMPQTMQDVENLSRKTRTKRKDVYQNADIPLADGNDVYQNEDISLADIKDV